MKRFFIRFLVSAVFVVGLFSIPSFSADVTTLTSADTANVVIESMMGAVVTTADLSIYPYFDEVGYTSSYIPLYRYVYQYPFIYVYQYVGNGYWVLITIYVVG